MGPGPMGLEISNSNIIAIRQPIGPNLKYEQFSGGFNDGNNEEPGQPGISKKKLEGDGSRAHGSRSRSDLKMSNN